MPLTLAAASSLSSQCFSFSELSTFSLSSFDLCCDYVGSTSLQTTPPCSHFLMCTLPLFALSRRMAEPTPFLPPFFLLQKSLHSGGLQLRSPPLELKRYFRPRGEEVFDWLISSDLLLLNDPDIPTLLHRSTGSRSSPAIFFAPSSIALSCTWDLITF